MRRGRSGFTLVELMLVVIIIGVLAAMVVPRLSGRTEQAKIARAKADLAAIGVALDLYELDHGKYPDSLSALEEKTEDHGPYLKRKPKDPWSRDYTYKNEASGSQDYTLYSQGSDPQASDDDITNTE